MHPALELSGAPETQRTLDAYVRTPDLGEAEQAGREAEVGTNSLFLRRLARCARPQPMGDLANFQILAENTRLLQGAESQQVDQLPKKERSRKARGGIGRKKRQLTCNWPRQRYHPAGVLPNSRLHAQVWASLALIGPFDMATAHHGKIRPAGSLQCQAIMARCSPGCLRLAAGRPYLAAPRVKMRASANRRPGQRDIQDMKLQTKPIRVPDGDITGELPYS